MQVFVFRVMAAGLLLAGCVVSSTPAQAESFEGKFFAGEGDTEYLALLDMARRMFAPDPEFQNLSMLYTPVWNGFVEGPTWNAWWVQNSYGTTYAALPFLCEPYTTFLQNAQDLWFDQMGDGTRAGNHGYVAPDGSLCDAAAPGVVHFRQGDGRHDIHDWGMEFTAAGLLMQAELLLISRDPVAVDHYLPMLERCANFIETRRDPENNLFLAGPAGNLLAPSYAGWRQADGTFEKAYLTGLSISYIAALDRLAELERLAGRGTQADVYAARREAAREGLAKVTTPEGYFIKSLDPDGTRHGVYGAEKHGYFESSPNHDAIAFRVVDDAQARRIYEKIASIPGLRRHGVIIANEPGLDDMYDPGESWLWQHGTWVNGGHWSTCEARMVLAYYRLGAFPDARRSMEHLLGFAREFRMDNPLVEFGSKVYQPREPINLCYDSFGPAAAQVRGLFEYLYRADSLTLIPHIPPAITRLEQRFPVRFGEKRLYIATCGSGPVTGVRVNGKPWKAHTPKAVQLAYGQLPRVAVVELALGEAPLPAWDEARLARLAAAGQGAPDMPDPGALGVPPETARLLSRAQGFYGRCAAEGLAESYEAAHARLIMACAAVIDERAQLRAEGQLPVLPEASEEAADASYRETLGKLSRGLEQEMGGPEMTEHLKRLWEASEAPAAPEMVVDIDVNDEVWLRPEPMTETEVDQLVNRLHEAGCNTLIVRAGCLGLLPYQTELSYPVGFDAAHARANPCSIIPDMEAYIAERGAWNEKYAQVIADINPPAAFIRAGHERGMKVILWLDIFDDGFPGYRSKFLDEHPHCQWTARDGKTDFEGVMSYAWPEARAFRVAQARELLDLGADGIHCSTSCHCRHMPNTHEQDFYGFEQPIVDAYQARYGVDIRTSDGFDREAWHDIKGEAMVQLYRDLASLCHARDKEFWVGLQLGRYTQFAADPHFSDNIVARYTNHWQTLVEEGIADTFILGDYEAVSAPGQVYWKAKEDIVLASGEDLYGWAAQTYQPYCQGKTKLLLFSEWLPGDMRALEEKMRFFAGRVVQHGFDGIDVHEAWSFEAPMEKMQVLDRFSGWLTEGMTGEAGQR